ncbi:uncharacterized protein LOC127855464 isoform X2 [Dreissena polymorpha]|uniref:uncharacterized protein LOC127855464 isoform X2 n=1 Tax=Dreissena polymorpha TaxID=45954 RepID=UPI00226567FC|nr:uncharacterized protein LOC127855464 isoform X2 [Dreissena polymorpha]
MIYLRSLLLCSVFVGPLMLGVCAQGTCNGNTPCLCSYENGQFLDFTSLGNKDDTPRFYNVSDKYEYAYSWNPCYNFTEGNCSEVSVCKIESAIPYDLYTPLGYQNSYEFVTNRSDNSVELVYQAGTGSGHIRLICVNGSTTTSLIALGPPSQQSHDFYFELRSPLCCPQGTPLTSISTTMEPTTRCPACAGTSGLKDALIGVSCVGTSACGLHYLGSQAEETDGQESLR